MNKIELMKKITSSFSLYGAAKWLSKSRLRLNKKTPAEYIKEGKIDEVALLLEQDNKKKDGSG